MRVAVISKADSAGGGASRVASQLVDGLNASGEHQAIHVNTWRETHSPSTVPLFGRWESLYHRLRKLEKKTGWVDYLPFESRRLRRILKEFKADVVHFHDISSAFSILTVDQVSKKYPTVWTFHDVSPVTGGCLYPGSCARFEQGCGGCPQLGEWPLDTGRDKTAAMARTKRKTLDKGRITTVAPSRWMQVLAGSQMKVKPRVIFNGIALNNYQSLSAKQIAEKKNELRLDPKLLTISWSCSDFADPRKGAKIAVDALTQLFQAVGPKFQLVLLGNLSQKVLDQLPDVPLYIAGYVKSEKAKGELLQIADAFLYTSLQDNQPLTVLEALSAGSEVVGLRTGGIPELSSSFGDALHLFNENQIDDIVSALKSMTTKRRPRERQLQVQALSAKYISMDTHVSKHIALYEELAPRA
jgi:glycosyltransferase involved in cell wall biosynthesis